MKYTFLNRFIFDLFTFIFLSVCSVRGYMVEARYRLPFRLYGNFVQNIFNVKLNEE